MNKIKLIHERIKKKRKKALLFLAVIIALGMFRVCSADALADTMDIEVQAENDTQEVTTAGLSTPTSYTVYTPSTGAALAVNEKIMLSDALLNTSSLMLTSSNYVDWVKHSWSASYNGTNLVLAFDIDFYATGYGTSYFYPKYLFGYSTSPTTDRTPSNILKAETTLETKVISLYGTASFTEFKNTGGTSGSERHFVMKGTVTVNNNRLNSLTGGGFRFYAGGWKGDDWAAAQNGGMTISNFDAAYKKATCQHSSYTYASGGSTGHTKTCSECGYALTETHTLSGGKCDMCGYTSTVSIKISYILNGSVQTETLSLKPGEMYQPKTITGYKKPDEITVPDESGSVSISYEPISYTITDGADTYLINYDDSLFIPGKEIKGYIQKSYIITELSAG